MSIESKRAYRFDYLKSEQWQNVRLEALAREGGKCQICGEESLHNDAHHIWYPKNIYKTRARQLVIMCRECHDFVHSLMPDCKTNDKIKGLEIWNRFRNAIRKWRMSKLPLFNSPDGIKVPDPKALRGYVKKLEEENARLRSAT